jgi:16S rRNA (cytosine967-C5)-methyltransferase
MTAAPAAVEGSIVRTLAATLFRTCLDRKITVEDALESDTRAGKLPPRDRALLATILLTAFRHMGEIEAVLKGLLDKPLPRKSGPAGDILFLGVAQLLFLQMPAHAVIDQSVRAAKADRNALHFSGLVNAVLRKVAAGGASLLSGVDTAKLNTPAWLWDRWTAFHGVEAARQIGLAHAARPALDISLKGDPAGWQARLGGVLLPNGQLRLPADHAPVPELAGFQDGGWWIQDAAATIPAALLGDVGGLDILDLCAAPGGKTLQMAAGGARVTAVDVSEARLGRLRSNLARTGLVAEVRVADMLSPELSGQWDAVLLDAPCSATGTIRRHPELPHIRQESQLKELASLQRQMLRKAATLVKPGGRLVYCTCSLEPEEGEFQLRWFRGWNTDFELVPATLPWLPPQAVAPEGWVRTLPFMSLGDAQGMDGFFAVVLRRRA